jgi:hypothetical protein
MANAMVLKTIIERFAGSIPAVSTERVGVNGLSIYYPIYNNLSARFSPGAQVVQE